MTSPHSPAEVLVKLLVAAGKLSDPTEGKPWPAFIGHSPEAPDDCVVAFDTTPIITGRILATGETHRMWGIQLRLRSSKGLYPEGWRKLTGLDNYLTTLHNTIVVFEDATYGVQSVSVDTGPLFIGQDEQSRRNLFTLNLLVNLYLI